MLRGWGLGPQPGEWSLGANDTKQMKAVEVDEIRGKEREECGIESSVEPRYAFGFDDLLQGPA